MGTSGSSTVSTRQQQIAKLAQQARGMSFTSLNHHVDIDWLKEAYRKTRKDGATGVDGQTADDYAAALDSNLQGLLERAKSGTYFAPPVKRTYIPKSGGPKDELRPIGIPTFEDKVLQRAVSMLLEPLYEQDFLNCSFGFRPGRSQHQALSYLWKEQMSMGGGWVINLDIRKFFDTLSHAHLRELIERRVRDGVVKRLIGKWLNAGVLEGGTLSYPEAGSPQGGVISPVLSNVYLHYVLDEWFEQEVKPRLAGRAAMVRFADDARLVFALESDARKVLEVLPKRFAAYGLTMHPEKTTLVDFTRPRQPPGELANVERPDTFDFLGFTHYWGKTRKGGWIIKRRTARDRLDKGLKKISEFCRRNRHKPMKMQCDGLKRKLDGHFNYFGITCNYQSLKEFKLKAVRIWRSWLSRRSQRSHVTWERMGELLLLFPLPKPRIRHQGATT